jgi:hypothetical protein
MAEESEHTVTFVSSENIKGPPAPNEVHAIHTAGGKEIPQGTILEARLGSLPNTVQVRIKLPGQEQFSDLGNLPLRSGIIELPLKLVFLCHAHEDRPTVESIGGQLWQDGYLTWFDKKDLLPGDSWQEMIEEAIEKADFFLAFLSKNSVSKTGFVQREIKYALQQRDLRPLRQRYIIPILLEECDLPREFRTVHWARHGRRDGTKSYYEPWEKRNSIGWSDR